MNTFKKLLSLVVILTLGFMSVGAPSADAAFNRNNIIDDSVFANSSTMSASAIDSWLNSKFPSSCISTNNGFHSPDPTGYSPSGGFTYGGNVSAGRVIYDASKAYGINPQVLLATLQKESSVVSGTASYHCAYINTAMGYGCPDSGSCPTNPATMSGFSKQVIHAAWLLRFGQQRSLGNTGWNVQLNNYPVSGDHWDNSDDPPTTYGGPMTQGNRARVHGGSVVYYNGYTTIDGTSVHMDTGATAALYWYTPHFSGNQHFYDIFTSWFGSTSGTPFFQVSGDSKIYMQGAHSTYYYVSVPGMMKAYGYGKYFFSIAQYPSSYKTGQTYGGALPQVARFEDDPVYMVDLGGTHHFPSLSMYNAFGYSLGDEAELPSWLYYRYSHPESMALVLRQVKSPKVYYMQSGEKRHIINPTAYNTLGSPVYSSQDSVRLTDGYVSGLATGPPIMPSDTFVKVSDTGGYGYWNGSTLQKISSIAGRETGIGVGYEAPSSDLYQLSTSSSTMDSLVKNSGGTEYIISGHKKLTLTSGQLSNLGLTSTDFLTVSDTLLNKLSTAALQAPLIRINGGNAVYEVRSGELYFIPTRTDLEGLGYNLGQVVNVGNTTAALFTNNSKYGLALGRPIWVNGQPQVYIIDSTSSKAPVPTRQVLSAYGHSINDVINVTSANIPQYASNSSALGVYMKDGSNNFWLIDSGKRHAVSSTLLGASYYDVDQPGVQVISNSLKGVIPASADLTDLVKDSSNGRVYRVSDGSRHWFVNRSSFDANGGNWSDVVTVSSDFINSIPSGSNIN